LDLQEHVRRRFKTVVDRGTDKSLVWAQHEADKLGIGYQTLLNMKLREAMSGSQDDHIREIVREELKKRA